MKEKIYLVLVTILVISFTLLSSCTTSTTSSTTATTDNTSLAPTSPTTTAPSVTVTTTQTSIPSQSNWWDKFGEPKYGGTINWRTGAITPNWDVKTFIGADYSFYFENLFTSDWTTDRSEWDFKTTLIPEKYTKGSLAEGWEMTDPTTMVIHIRQGVHWQDKEPVNGREFTAYDVQEHFDRIMGTGSGYTELNPVYAADVQNFEKFTATDKYSVELKLKTPAYLSMPFNSVRNSLCMIEAPEAVDMEGGALTDWKKAVGTGPWILGDYVAGSSVVYVRNPSYWGYDERHPENKLPYADELHILVINDDATAIAAFRSGQVDLLGGDTFISYEQTQNITKTNPDAIVDTMPGNTPCVQLRLDEEPFSDIKVRIAMQMAVNTKAIAETYYKGQATGIPAGLINPVLKGYAFDYADWPQDLKDEYSFNSSRAKELLADAGYPEGFNTNVIANNVMDLQLLQIYQSFFKDIGIEMEIQQYDLATWQAMMGQRKFDQAAYAYLTVPFMAYRDLTSSSPNNTCELRSDYYDDLVKQIDTSATEEECMRLVTEADKFIISQHVAISAGPVNLYSVWQPYFKGYSGEKIRTKSQISQIFARCWKDQ